jgi:glycogen operon protein
VSDGFLADRGLSNYWGYNTIGFFAPHAAYASVDEPSSVIAEFKHMVRSLHQAGIEVILDVVFNHTAEGNHLGPTLSFRGIDNAAYYRLDACDPAYYEDYTGTGNTLQMQHPFTLQLVMDSLRYWIEEMHVDGFRFDLAPALARGRREVERVGTFFDLIQQDPVISRVKLIAEPWDCGAGGYQSGRFPPLWSEWNGRYRDWVRDYWCGRPATLAELGARVTGSRDLYADPGRLPRASVNFVACHDGFTLRDVVSYDRKHNVGNREDERDGEDDNHSWNCGAEGATDDPEVLQLRARQQRNLLATLLLSQGVPMLLAGDELGRTQRGNNNAYCQDNRISWVDWSAADRGLLAFTRQLVHLRLAHPVLRLSRWVGDHDRTIAWCASDGRVMRDDQWTEGGVLSLEMVLAGDAVAATGPRGRPIDDDTFLVLFHAHWLDREFVLPGPPWAESWQPVLATDHDVEADGPSFAGGARVIVQARSLWLLRKQRP